MPFLVESVPLVTGSLLTEPRNSYDVWIMLCKREPFTKLIDLSIVSVLFSFTTASAFGSVIYYKIVSK